ncbi:hypothetical protein [Denitrobaculum tricleocarpae]|uniref:Uncharacterized protein n=1 Tax=Denitrobaculum tricleocarpae TaxID=2591009 RepID=A0A545T3W0_9PROT|nr:hypothetical protein [Denitrobaculum tricleocarpae]TQV71894.1 hypothetical protein FKG95_26300 [Denitrobaculum tricleocarpae]
MRSVSPSPPPSQPSGTAAPSQTASSSGTVTPVPPATGAAATSPAATQPVQIPIVKAPEPLSTLPGGTVLSGTVATAEESALLKIMTRYGSFELDSKLALASGTKVALQIRDGGQVQLQIVKPEIAANLPDAAAKALADAAVRLPNQILLATLQSRGNPSPAPAAGNTLQGGNAPGNAPGSSPVPGAAPPGNAAAASLQIPAVLRQLTAGAQFQVQLTAINGGAAGVQANPTATTTATPASATAPGVTAQGPAAGPAGPAAATGASVTANDPILSGTVIASAAKGRPVLQTPFGILSLENGVQLPLGTKVQIQILSSSLPQATAGSAAPLNPLAHPLQGSNFAWPSLDVIARQGEANALSSSLASKIMSRVPTAGAALSSNMLFLLSALNTGQLNGWLGRATVDQMQREGHRDLVGKLDQDLAQAGRISDAAGGEWRTLILPFLDDQQIRQLRLFIRRDQEDGEGDGQEQSGADTTRFVLEIELTKTGDLQLDGLIRSKLFDLILRTRSPFPQSMRDEIIRIFNESNHSLGLAGQIVFEASGDWRSKTIESAGLTDSPDLMI